MMTVSTPTKADDIQDILHKLGIKIDNQKDLPKKVIKYMRKNKGEIKAEQLPDVLRVLLHIHPNFNNSAYPLTTLLGAELVGRICKAKFDERLPTYIVYLYKLGYKLKPTEIHANDLESSIYRFITGNRDGERLVRFIASITAIGFTVQNFPIIADMLYGRIAYYHTKFSMFEYMMVIRSLTHIGCNLAQNHDEFSSNLTKMSQKITIHAKNKDLFSFKPSAQLSCLVYLSALSVDRAILIPIYFRVLANFNPPDAQNPAIAHGVLYLASALKLKSSDLRIEQINKILDLIKHSILANSDFTNLVEFAQIISTFAEISAHSTDLPVQLMVSKFTHLIPASNTSSALHIKSIISAYIKMGLGGPNFICNNSDFINSIGVLLAKVPPQDIESNAELLVLLAQLNFMRGDFFGMIIDPSQSFSTQQALHIHQAALILKERAGSEIYFSESSKLVLKEALNVLRENIKQQIKSAYPKLILDSRCPVDVYIPYYNIGIIIELNISPSRIPTGMRQINISYSLMHGLEFEEIVQHILQMIRFHMARQDENSSRHHEKSNKRMRPAFN